MTASVGFALPHFDLCCCRLASSEWSLKEGVLRMYQAHTQPYSLQHCMLLETAGANVLQIENALIFRTQ